MEPEELHRKIQRGMFYQTNAKRWLDPDMAVEEVLTEVAIAAYKDWPGVVAQYRLQRELLAEQAKATEQLLAKQAELIKEQRRYTDKTAWIAVGTWALVLVTLALVLVTVFCT